MKYYNFSDYERKINYFINMVGLKNRCFSINGNKSKSYNNKGILFRIKYKNC